MSSKYTPPPADQSADVVGPASAVNNDVVTFDGTTGKLVKDSGQLLSGLVVGPAVAVNNDVVTYDGTTGKLVKDSGQLLSGLATKTYADSGDATAIATAEAYADARDVITLGTAEAYSDAALLLARETDLLRPTGFIAETASRIQAVTAGATSVTGRETLIAIGLYAGQSAAAITMGCNSPMVGGTHQWFSLRDATKNLIRTTADDIDTAWGTQNNKTLPLSRIISDANITSGAAILTSATAAFTNADIGKKVSIVGAGAAGVLYGTSATPRTILSIGSATSATLSANAGTTVTGGVAYIATPYTIPTTGQYYLGIMVAAGTPPQMVGPAFLSGQLNSLPPILCGVDNTNTGLTVPSGAPSPSAALTAFTLGIWAAVS